MNMREAFSNLYRPHELSPVRLFEAGYAAAIEAVKAGGAYDCAKGDEFSCACSMYKLYKLPEDVA